MAFLGNQTRNWSLQFLSVGACVLACLSLAYQCTRERTEGPDVYVRDGAFRLLPSQVRERERPEELSTSLPSSFRPMSDRAWLRFGLRGIYGITVYLLGPTPSFPLPSQPPSVFLPHSVCVSWLLFIDEPGTRVAHLRIWPSMQHAHTYICTSACMVGTPASDDASSCPRKA